MLFASSVIFLLGGYLVRIIFTRVFTAQILGVEGLFADILSILSLTEMGFESAITFALYEPIAHGDIEKQKSVMQLCKRFYRIIAGVVFAGGMIVMLFLPALIKDGDNVEHLYVYYFLYLINSVFSYLLTYKRTLIDAHQLIYINMFYTVAAFVLQDILQIILLLTMPSYLLYLLIGIAATLGKNYILSWKATGLYPYLKDRDIAPLSKEDKSGIVKNMRAMIYHKVGQVAVNNTDNLILSACVGLEAVAMYSNYAMITNAVRNIIMRVFKGLSASIGNFRVTESDDAVAKVYEMTFFLGGWITCISTVCLYRLLSAFVGLSFGDKYVLEPVVVLVLCLNFMAGSMGDTTLIFRDSLGLFWYDRFKPVAETILNLVLSLIFVQYWGITGVFMGTLVSHLATGFWIEPYVVYKHGLHRKCGRYFVRYFMYVGATFVSAMLTELAFRAIPGENYITILLAGLPISVLIPAAVFVVFFFWTREFKGLKDIAWKLIRDRQKG